MINYDLRKIKALVFDVDGVLSRSTLRIDGDGRLLRSANAKDVYALRLAAQSGLCVAIITGAHEEDIRRRYQMIGVADVYLASSVKTVSLQDLLAKHALLPHEVLYMGDDIPDIPVLRQVGVPCCPRDAAAEVRSESLYVSHIDGGDGCVRDVVEQVLKAQGKWMAGDAAFAW